MSNGAGKEELTSYAGPGMAAGVTATGACKVVESNSTVLLGGAITDVLLPENVNFDGLKTDSAAYHLWIVSHLKLA